MQMPQCGAPTASRKGLKSGGKARFLDPFEVRCKRY